MKEKKEKNQNKLKLHDENITSLPAEILKQTSLEELEIIFPKVTSLPKSFKNLSNLRTLTIRCCNLPEIPDFICEMAKLEKLEIHMDSAPFFNPYTILKKIPASIGKLKNLSYLSLNEVRITQIPASLSNCPLKYLEFNGGFRTLPESFGNLTKLETLKISSSKTLTLPESFRNLHSLKELKIGAPHIKNPEILTCLTALEDLTIFTEDFVLPRKIGNLTNLKELYLNVPKMKTLSNAIGNCKNLKDLYIENNLLTKLPQSFCRLKNLEVLSLECFALKALPAKIGSLSKLKDISLFSGSITELPQSMAKLKNIKNLYFDLFNLKTIPQWCKNNGIKSVTIQTKNEEEHIYRENSKKKPRKEIDPACHFNYYVKMGYEYRCEILDTYPVKKIEDILLTAPYYSSASEDEKSVFKDIMFARSRKLNIKFKWTEENINRAVLVSEEFIKAYKEGYAKAKKMLNVLYKKEKASFEDKYAVKITLCPEINFEDSELDDKIKHHKWEFYNKITSYINYGAGLHYFFRYDPAKKDDSDFLENINIKRDLSWNIEGFGDIELRDRYISYPIHELFSHNEWAIEDILRINSICTNIKFYCDGDEF